ncbi:hypothetical protein JCM3775_005242, partial [Rhodotorula graminis]
TFPQHHQQQPQPIDIRGMSGFNPAQLLLSGLMTGTVVGYLFTQESLKLQLAKARAAHAQLQSHLSSPEEQLGLDGREKGFGGLEGLEDKFASTRGEH